MPQSRSRIAPQLACLVGNSPAIRRIRSEIEKIADSSASVLITGPSGAGKEVAAQLLHQRSRRAAQPFVALNCAAVATDILESEMFGHEAGAFTGAIRARQGRFEAAHRGTLFLDEVGDMAPAMQVKLLRALETRVVERVGGMLPIAVDVRILAATSVDLAAAIDRGHFRSDLLYRLDVVRIDMPGLAARPQDIPLLVEHFCPRPAGAPPPFDAAALALLMEQPWPGNVRELKNVVDRAAAHFGHETVGRDRLLALLRPAARPVATAMVPAVSLAGALSAAPPRDLAGGVDLKRVLADLECAYITEALTASGGAVAATAKLLGLHRTTLIEKMRRFQIGPPGTA